MPLRHWLFLGVCVLLALLLLMWLRRRRRRVRRNTLQVWQPGKTQRAAADPAAEPALTPPPWLVNATREATAAPVENNSAASARPLPAETDVPQPVDPASAPGASASIQSDPAITAESAPAQNPPTDPAASASTPAVAALAAGFVTHVASLRGTALGPQPVPRVSVHVGADPGVHGTARPAMVTAAAAPAEAIPPSATRVALEATMITRAMEDAVSVGAQPRPALEASFVEARRLAAQDRPREALELLRPLLDAQAPATAWAMAGWCAWKLAQGDDNPLPAAVEAAHAFTQALAADPSRRTTLSRMIGRCHLRQAEADVPARRKPHLAAAVQAYAQGFGDAARASGSALLEWANALAVLATQSMAAERASWLAQLDAVLARGPRHADAAPVWCRLYAQAAWLHAAQAPTLATRTRLHAEAVAHLQRGHEQLGEAYARDQWLAESIEAERRYLATQSVAARVAGHAALAARAREPLAEASSAAPWLAWVHVLADGARLLQGPAARQRLAEAEAVFVRLEQTPAAADERQGIAFARAHYLRMRAAHERGGARQRLLDDASQVLAALRDSEFAAPAGVALEQAELALMRASTETPAAAQAHYSEAVAHASVAADAAPTRVPAFRTLLTALLCWQRLQPEPARLTQIGLVAQWLADADIPPSAETLRLRAAAALVRDDMVDAARLSAAAWEAGAEPRDVLPAWRQADAAWTRGLADSDRAAWEQQHRQLRLASGTR